MAEPIPPNNNLREQFVTEEIPVGLPWRLLIFSIILFGFSVFIYFGLKFGYESYLDSRAKELDRQIEELSNRVSVEDQQNFVNFYSQVANLRRVLDEHFFASNIFAFLEKNTPPTLYFYEAGLDPQGRLALSGRADSLETLLAQQGIFDKSAELNKVTLGEVSVVGNEVGFTMVLDFKPEFFKSPQL